MWLARWLARLVQQAARVERWALVQQLLQQAEHGKRLATSPRPPSRRPRAGAVRLRPERDVDRDRRPHVGAGTERMRGVPLLVWWWRHLVMGIQRDVPETYDPYRDEARPVSGRELCVIMMPIWAVLVFLVWWTA